jgi:uncharacterized membrane protein
MDGVAQFRDMNLDGFQPNEQRQTADTSSTAMDAGCQSLIVNASPAEVYERWSHFEDLPKFIKVVRTAQRIDETHFLFSWIKDGREREDILHVVLRVPGRRIAWRTVSAGFWLAVVTFEPLSIKATEITLKMSSDLDPLSLSQQLDEYLRNFKQLIEEQ